MEKIKCGFTELKYRNLNSPEYIVAVRLLRKKKMILRVNRLGAIQYEIIHNCQYFRFTECVHLFHFPTKMHMIKTHFTLFFFSTSLAMT